MTPILKTISLKRKINSNFFSFVFWGSEQEEELFHNVPEEFFLSVENSDSDSDN